MAYSKTTNSEYIKIRIRRPLIIMCFTVYILLFMSSCKTCKCPAYSNIEFKNAVNTGVTNV
jgi:hypothetical protein